ncbi:MAG: hypothetical protein HQM08_01675 [Candidatus Riflebacteria bacterium]|nr:hypothetical protein [Candidatus Riflebacteria bacterium]
MSNEVLCKLCGGNIEVPDNYAKPFIKCPNCQKMTNVALPSKPTSSTPPSKAANLSPKTPPGQTFPQPPGIFPPSSSSQFPPPLPTSPHTPRKTASVPSNDEEMVSPPGQSALTPNTQTTSELNDLPEIMKANKKLAGKSCSACGAPIELGEVIHNCPRCHGISHQPCWDSKGGCSNDCCIPSESASPRQPDGQGNGRSELVSQENMVPCRWCKEPIIREARKCKHCGEFQKDEDRQAQTPQGGIPRTDINLSVFDWFMVIVPCGCGCWIGLVYALMGKPKGRVMVSYGILSNILWKIIATVLHELAR